MTKIIIYKMVQRVYSQNEDTAQKDVPLECFSLAVLIKMDLNLFCGEISVARLIGILLCPDISLSLIFTQFSRENW